MRYSTQNFVATANSVAASSEHASYLAANLADDDGTKPWVAGAAAVADVTLTVDLEQNSGKGSYELGYAAAGTDASTAPGSVADEAAITHAGSKALKVLAGAGGIGRHYLTYTARPGQTWRYSAWLRGDGTGSARLRIKDPITGKWWVSGAWNASEGDVAARSTATYAESTGAVTFSGFAEHQCDSFAFEVHIVCTDSGQVAYADDVYLWPAWDLVILHGHNWPPAQGLLVQGSTDNSAWSTLETGDATRPSAYVLRDAQETYRYARVRAAGTSPLRLYAGMLWIGQAITPDPSFRREHSGSAALPQVVAETAAGRKIITSYATDAPRTLSLEWLARTSTEAREIQRSLFWSTRQGADLLAVVPVPTTRPECYIARIVEPLSEGVRLVSGGHAHTFRVVLAEDGHPTVSV